MHTAFYCIIQSFSFIKFYGSWITRRAAIITLREATEIKRTGPKKKDAFPPWCKVPLLPPWSLEGKPLNATVHIKRSVPLEI
jgi:hypothetical protein